MAGPPRKAVGSIALLLRCPRALLPGAGADSGLQPIGPHQPGVRRGHGLSCTPEGRGQGDSPGPRAQQPALLSRSSLPPAKCPERQAAGSPGAEPCRVLGQVRKWGAGMSQGSAGEEAELRAGACAPAAGVLAAQWPDPHWPWGLADPKRGAWTRWALSGGPAPGFSPLSDAQTLWLRQLELWAFLSNHRYFVSAFLT